jgi:hypothetical protein
MSDAPENPAPAPSPGLIARIAAAIANAPAPEPAPDAVALQSQLETLQADHSALTEAATAAADKLETVQGELATVQADLNQNCEILNAINLALPGVTAAANVAEFIQAQITAKAQEQIAASGFKPNEAPGTDPQAGNEQEAMPLAEFNQLSVSARNEYMAKGGKLK